MRPFRVTPRAVRRAIVGAVLGVLAAPGARSAAAQAEPSSAALMSQDSSGPTTQMVDLGGYRLRVRTAGTPTAGRPTVVFESGLGTPLENWNAVQRDLAREAATVTYDRAGIGRSEAGRSAPTLARMVDDLHALLAKTGTRPPYVLVGHSMGGAVIRLFAARYPGEVAGLVYVDPADFTLTVAAQDSLWREIDVPDGRRAFNAWASAAEGPPGMRAEIAMFGAEFSAGFPSFHALPPAPAVPTVVLLSGQQPPADSTFPGGQAVQEAFFAAWTRQRVAHMTGWARAGVPDAEGTLVVTPNSGHYIHATEPELVAWGVRRALFPDLAGRLARAAARGGADSVLALYSALRRHYPPATFDERTLNTVGYALLARGAVAYAVQVFERNVAEYPDASNPHDSLGEAYMAQGDRARAIASYERSLALDAQNANAVERLKALRAP